MPSWCTATGSVRGDIDAAFFALSVMAPEIAVCQQTFAIAAELRSTGAASKGGTQAFDSFSAFKRAMGPAGENMQWHHLVEQNPTNVAQFGQRALQTTDNLVPLSTPLHQQISGFYSSIRPDVTGSLTQTVRQWVSAQSFEAQTQFGQSILTKVLNGIKP